MLQKLTVLSQPLAQSAAPPQTPMAFKVSKPQALKLFMFVRQLKFSFDPFSSEARSLREMWRQVTSPTLIAANPKCKVETLMVRDAPPRLEMTFVNDKTYAIESPSTRPATALIADMYQTAHGISLEYAVAGKPPPG